jgi:Plant ATP synthase F0
MPQLDIFTIFFQIIQFFFIFWALYIYLLRKILPNIYKSLKIRNNKLNSLNIILKSKMPKLINFKKLELIELFNFHNLIYLNIYSYYVDILKLYNLKIFNYFYNFFKINYKLTNKYSDNLNFLCINKLKKNNLKIIVSKKLFDI